MKKRLKLKAEKEKALTTLSKAHVQANTENEELKSKVTSYMNSAAMYKEENEDLRVRCSELEEMLRQEEAKLEIANKDLSEVKEKYFNAKQIEIEYIKQIKTLMSERDQEYEANKKVKALAEDAEKECAKLREEKTQYFNAINASMEQRNYLENALEIQKQRTTLWEERYKEEASKSWWDKFKEGFRK